MKHIGPWTLQPSPPGQVVWGCGKCGVLIGFSVPGTGEPSSGTDVPPDDIDVYVGQDCVVVPDVVPREPITKLQFLNLFTAPEMAGILASTDANIKMFLFKFEQAQEVDLSYPETIQGVQYLAYLQLISPERAAEILA